MNEIRKAFPPPTDGSPVHISMAGITYPDLSYHITRPNSVVSVVEYIIDGEGYLIIDGETRHVSRDMIYFLPAGMNHEYYSDKDNPFTKIFMNINQSSFIDRMVSAYHLEGKHIFDGNGLKEVFERILVTIHSDVADDDMQPVFNGILCEIFSRLQKNEHISAHSDEAIKLKNYLDANLDRIVSSKELSSVIFRSTDYSLKLFSREFGITPYSYQIDRKIQIAKTLLSDTSMSVGEISQTLGYDDMHYFSNLFKAKTGVRPLAYRKSR